MKLVTVTGSLVEGTNRSTMVAIETKAHSAPCDRAYTHTSIIRVLGSKYAVMLIVITGPQIDAQVIEIVAG